MIALKSADGVHFMSRNTKRIPGETLYETSPSVSREKNKFVRGFQIQISANSCLSQYTPQGDDK